MTHCPAMKSRFRRVQDVRGSTPQSWQGGPLRAPVASPRPVAHVRHRAFLAPSDRIAGPSLAGDFALPAPIEQRAFLPLATQTNPARIGCRQRIGAGPRGRWRSLSYPPIPLSSTGPAKFRQFYCVRNRALSGIIGYEIGYQDGVVNEGAQDHPGCGPRQTHRRNR